MREPTRKPTLRTSGFTMIEVMVTIVILGLATLYFSQTVLGQTDDAKYSITKNMVTEQAPKALLAYYQSHPIAGRSLIDGHTGHYRDGYDAGVRELEKNGLRATTPWHDEVKLFSETDGSEGSKTVQIAFGVGGEVGTQPFFEAGEKLMADIEQNRSAYPMISRMMIGGGGRLNVFYTLP